MASIYEPPTLKEEIKNRIANYKRKHRRRYVSAALKAKLAREYNRIYRLRKKEVELRNLERDQKMQEEATAKGCIYNPHSTTHNVNACTVM
jgi:hypothetical protein